MKGILAVVLFFAANSVFAMESDFSGLRYTLEFDSASDTQTRQVRFSDFVNETIKELLKHIPDSAQIITRINEVLERYNIPFKIREQSRGSLACFAHDLAEVDFNDHGFLTKGAISRVETDGLSIDINCKYARDTRSFVIFNGGKEQELWCETPYCGNTMEYEGTGAVLREIGVTLCPFYVILFHELLHLKHFLDTVDFQLSGSKGDGFIPYGKALSVTSKDDYDSKLTPAQKSAFGDIAEFEDNIFVERLYNDLENIATSNDPSTLRMDIVQESRAKMLKEEGLMKDGTGEYLWKGKKVDLSIVKQLAAQPDWENLEEIRTVFGSKQDLISEDSVRETIGLPPRGIYGIPETKRYVLNSMVQKRYGVEKINREYSIGMSSKNMAESEAAYVPLLVRLLGCKDQVILKGARIRRGACATNTLQLVRNALNILQNDPDMEVSTPVRHYVSQTDDREEQRPPSLSEDESN